MINLHSLAQFIIHFLDTFSYIIYNEIKKTSTNSKYNVFLFLL
jgi:hypothetical protein